MQFFDINQRKIMTPSTILWAAFIAAVYAVWPVLGKWSKAPGQWVNTIVVAGSLIPIVILSINSMIKTPINNSKAFMLLLTAGIVNGFAVYVYGMKATDKTVPTGVFMMSISIMLFAFAPIIDWAFNGTTLSARQMFGIFIAGIAIYMLKG